MLALATAALVLAAPLDEGRFDRTSLKENQRAALAAHEASLEAVRGYYHWATHSVTLDRYIAQQKAVDIGQRLQASEEAVSRMAGALDAKAQAGVLGETTTLRDGLAKANTQLSRLRAESGAGTPSTTEVRFLTAELYRSLATVQETQVAIGAKLGITPEEHTRDRAR